jgi:hypothetical protein
MEPDTTDTMRRIEAAVKELADREYPRVWIGEEGMTPEEYLRLEEDNAELPEEMRVHPGEFVGIEGAGVRVPKIGYEYLDGLWVIENMSGEDLGDETGAELHREVLYMYAAKRGEVPIVTDSWERYEAELAPEIRRVPLGELAPEDAPDVLENVEFYATDTTGPYVIEDSERARAALEKRLEA